MVGADALSKVIFIYSFMVIPSEEYSPLASTTLLSPEVSNCAPANAPRIPLLTLLPAISNPKLSALSGATLKVAGAVPLSASVSDIPLKPFY